MPPSATLADVARRAGVSTATVSRVLNGGYPVSEHTRAKVAAAVRDLDYVLNGPARALAAATSDVVGVLVNDIADPFFGILARGVQRAAGPAGVLVSISTSEGDRSREPAFLEHLRRQRARAAILVGGASEDPADAAAVADRARALRAQGGRVVVCGRPPIPGVDPVGIAFDDRAGMRAVTAHLLALGHRAVTCLAGPERNTTASQRLAGVRDAVACTPADLVVVRSPFARQSGYEATLALLDGGGVGTAIVAANDLLAVGALAALRERGRRVPDDVSVVGCDDLPVCVDSAPALTTVRLPLEEAGTRAAALAIDGAEPAWVTLPHELVVRHSTARRS